ncbi:MAG: ABC transporter substrate-binding protein [Syntrophales bacterium]|nr:ABC transporter substrate-binding protein [Syntrophales bacterium]
MKRGFLLFSLLTVIVFSWVTPCRADEIVIGYTGPLSGPAAEYGQDIFNGIDMAVKEINAAGGIMVGGKKYLFRLEKLDDRIDPTQAVNNARRFRANGAIAVFNGVFTTIAPMMKINEEKGNEFIMMAYTSTPKVTEMNNKLLVNVTLPFTVYVEVFTDWAKKKGWKKCAIACTLGAYGDEWRHIFKEAWERKGGVITIQKPANYYWETDFSAPLTAALATKPDFMLIGGPSATTALFIEQARNMGFKGGFVLVDQAKQDYIAMLLKGTQLMGDLIGTAGVSSLPPYPGQNFDVRYTKAYKRMVTWECALNFTAVHYLARAIQAAGTTTDVYKIRAAFPKAFPVLADKFPNEAYGITEKGNTLIMASVQTVTGGKSDPSSLYVWWTKSKKEFEDLKKITKTDKSVPIILFPTVP